MDELKAREKLFRNIIRIIDVVPNGFGLVDGILKNRVEMEKQKQVHRSQR